MLQRWMTKFLKVIFVISTACFLIIQIHMRRRTSLEHLETHYKLEDTVMADNNGELLFTKISMEHNKNDKIIYYNHYKTDNDVSLLSGKRRNGSLTTLILGSIDAVKALEKPYKLPDVDEIRKSVEDNNANTIVLNDQDFHEEISHVVVVQVHNRSKYLEKLIQSISNAANVSRMLLIFSHDYFSREIDTLVQSIKFCRVMQIFYPYSMQIYPHQFPGQDPKDCPPKVGKEKAAEIKCQNWKHPDKYGNYRVAKYSQVKHHWWWKINYVFDGIARLKNYTGWVLLLEEDHYVSPDFLFVFEQIIQRKKELCEECSIISLGFYLKSYDEYASTTDKLSVFPWFSSRHNMGMAFNRETWNKIHACSKNFCYFDDYNWDWSLMHINLKCLSQPTFKVIFAKAPRVFHIGDCGIHHAGKQCTADSSATKFAQILESARDRLFPAQMVVGERSGKTLKAPKENGGWGDVRDHELCMRHAATSEPESQGGHKQR